MKKSKVLIAIVMLLLCTTMLVGCTTETVQTGVQSDKSNTKKQYTVGETFENKNLTIKFVSADKDFTGYSEWADVKDGYKVIKAEFEFENIGDTDEYVSSYDFSCYADGYDCEEFWSVDDSSFGATLSSGKKTKGCVYFEVPINSAEIELEYILDYWSESKAVFEIQ